MIKSVVSFFAPSLQEIIDAAIKKASTLHGQVEEASKRADYYTTLVNSIDPWVDHHSFAAARDNQLNAQGDHAELSKQHELARARADQLLSEFDKESNAPAAAAFEPTFDYPALATASDASLPARAAAALCTNDRERPRRGLAGECQAIGRPCEFGPHGIGGGIQCLYCGAPEEVSESASS